MANDLTRGKPWKLILTFSLPIIIGNLLQQFYNLADSVIVGNLLGSYALSAVGTCASPTMLFTALAIGFSNGAAIIVSQFYGAKQHSEMRKAVSTAIIFLFAIGLAATVLASALAHPLLKYALGVPEENGILEMATIYFRWYAIGLVFQFGYNIFASILRSIGDSKATLYFLLASSIINIALDFLFVAGLGLGVAGAAIATTISQFCSCLLGYLYMTRKYELFRFKLTEFHFHGDKCRMILSVGVPAALQQCVVSCGHLLIQRLVNSYGSDMIAAFTAAQRVEQFIIVPIISYQAGVSMYTGQNVGAGEYSRIKTGLWQGILMSFGTTLALAVTAIVFASPLIGLFGVEGQAFAYGCEYLSQTAPMYLVFSFYIIILGVLQGSGDVKVSMFCTMLALAVRVSLGYLLAWNTPLSYRAIWWGMFIGWSCAAVVAICRYASGRWKTKSLVKKGA